MRANELSISRCTIILNVRKRSAPNMLCLTRTVTRNILNQMDLDCNRFYFVFSARTDVSKYAF